MEADKTSRLSALLACRSRADLRRLGEVDSASSAFITLACKHNRTDLLKLLLKRDSSSPSDDAVTVVPRQCSVEQEDEGHNAVYYAIRSSNVELLSTLLKSVTPELSERLISQAYQELLLNNVFMSEEVHMFVQHKLLDLRFFSKGDVALPATSSVNILERIQLLLENISHINTYTEVDSHFLYTAKFITQNIHILKQQLKSTYNILPWEEMEFCLVSFVSAHIRRHELNVFYLSVLKKERLLKELDTFASDLQELEEHIKSTDVRMLRKSVASSREDIADAISSRYPHLYADYKELRDVSSLHIMETYLDAALLADSGTRLGQLTIKRALQVTGEHLKNTLDSPKLSPAVSDLLLLSAPKETRKVLQDLRNSLSHPHLELKDSVIYSNIQNDIKKIASVITDITKTNKADKIKSMLTALVDTDSVEEFKEIANIFQNVCLVNEKKTVTKEPVEIENLIRIALKKVVDKTPYEKKLFADINDILDKIKWQSYLSSADYGCLKLIAFTFSFYANSKYFHNMIRDSKLIVNKVLENNPIQKNSSDFVHVLSLGSLLYKFFISVSTRITPEIVDEMLFVIARYNYGQSNDKDNINCIDEFSRQVLLDKSNKNDNGVKKRNVKNSSGVVGEQISLKLTEIGNSIGTDRVFGKLYEHLTLLQKDETTNRFMVEALVLDTMTLLDNSKSVHNNMLYLDGDMPLLSGKCLRNHLAHGNALVDILPTDAWSAVLLNAVKLSESKEILLNRKIGNIVKHDIEQLRRRYELGISILDKQNEMWKSLLDGNFENLALEIAGGAEICSRKKDLSSTLHYAARGPSVEIIKFLVKQKNIRTESEDINGQTALHVAAAFGREKTVKFLVIKMRNTINKLDVSGKTPLHFASQNGHKKTVEILLSLGAKNTITDMMGYSPLRFAVMNNHLHVVKTLLAKDVTVDINIISGGSSLLHNAAEIGHTEIVKYLLRNDADVNAKDMLGSCPLHLAAFNGHLEVVNVLLERGAHVNFRDSMGHSSLHNAVANSHKEIVKILLEKGAYVNNGEVTYKAAPLHTAAYEGDKFIIGLLLQYKANVNAIRNDGFTPLLFAAKGGHADIVELLLQNRARADSRDINGATALHIAALHGRTSVVEILIRVIDINTQNTYRATPLHIAANTGHRQVVDTLLAAGVYIHCVDIVGCTALHYSAANGHDEISEALLKKGAKVNCRNRLNLTPLHLAAAESCNEKTVQMLLKYEASVDEREKLCRTALHIAAFAGHSPTVEALLQGMADVHAEDNSGATALHLAASGNHRAVVEILLHYGSDVNHLDTEGSSALCYAAKNNNKDLMGILIAKGADVNVGGGKLLLSAIKAGRRHVVEALLKNKNVDIDITHHDGSNLLCMAAVNGDSLIARALINRGVKVVDSIKDPSPLLIAISYGHTEFVEVLLENGANVNPVDPNLSPVFVAVHKNKPDIMERLLHWGAKSNIRDSMNRTPLELAVGLAQMPNVLILLQQTDVGINERRNDNWTLLHIAALAGNLEVTSLLVDRGADVDALDINGSKPIHIATARGHHNILAFFLELGMSIGELDSNGRTLMHVAATEGHLAVVQFLIGKHVEINSTNLNGSTPLHCSVREGHTEVVKFLLHSGAVYNATDLLDRTPVDVTESPDIKKILESIEILFKAVKKNDVMMISTLVKYLAKYVDVKSSDNATLLHIASWKGFQEACDILLKSKANPNVVGKGGNAPLHYASKYSHPGIVEALLKNGAVHDLKASNMKTPLDFATQKDIKYLLQKVAVCFKKVQTRDVRLIKDITKIRDEEVVKAVMKARDTDGNTLVVVAMKNDFPDTDELKQVCQPNVHTNLMKVESLFMRERFADALEILKPLLDKRIEILGEDNPGTLDIQKKIVTALYKQSKYSEAMSMLEDIYKKRVEVFGPYNADSLETRSTIALILHRLGRDEESWDIFQEVMIRQQEVLGEGHKQLIRTKSEAGLTLLNLGKYEKAMCLYNQVLKTHKKTLDADRPNSLPLYNNIGLVLLAQDKPHEAFAMFQSVYESRKIILGPNHSDTLRARRNMALALAGQHKSDEALQVYEEILSIQKNVLGPNHVDTLYTQNHLRSLYLSQKNISDALKVHKAGLDAKNVIFGPNHPHFNMMDELFTDVEKYVNLKYGSHVFYTPPCDFILLRAVSEGEKSKVCRLIENGSDVNTADGEGRTALHFATTVEIVELLLESGADARAVSQKGNTPLHLATSRACEKTVRLLLHNVKRNKPKASFPKFINAKTAVGGSTALHVAAKMGAADIVRCLLDNGACYNIRDRIGNLTPLQCSTSLSVTRLLRLAEEVFEMARGGGTMLPQGDEMHLAAVLNSRDTEHRTPLQLAVINGHTGTARVLAGLLKPVELSCSA